MPASILIALSEAGQALYATIDARSRDASVLGARLREGLTRQTPIAKIVDEYQVEMSAYAFPLVRSSTVRLQRLNIRNPFLRWVMLKVVPW